MRNYLTNLPVAVALTGAFLWFSAARAFADCYLVTVCVDGRCFKAIICF